MGSAKKFLSQFRIFGELLVFMHHRKLWWLIPMIVVLVLFGLLFVFAGSSGVAPFIYSLF